MAATRLVCERVENTDRTVTVKAVVESDVTQITESNGSQCAKY